MHRFLDVCKLNQNISKYNPRGFDDCKAFSFYSTKANSYEPIILGTGSLDSTVTLRQYLVLNHTNFSVQFHKKNLTVFTNSSKCMWTYFLHMYVVQFFCSMVLACQKYPYYSTMFRIINYVTLDSLLVKGRIAIINRPTLLKETKETISFVWSSKTRVLWDWKS